MARKLIDPYWETVGERMYLEVDVAKAGWQSSTHMTDKPFKAGIVGEYAVGARLGMEPDTESRAKGDRGYDFVFYGRRIDSKASTHVATRERPGYLLVKPEKVRLADVFVAVFVDFENGMYEIMGDASQEMVREAEPKDLGYGPSHAVPYSELRNYDWWQLPVWTSAAAAR